MEMIRLDAETDARLSNVTHTVKLLLACQVHTHTHNQS